MKEEKSELWWHLKTIGIWMVATGIVGTLLVAFVLPANAYLSGFLLLLLGMDILAGLVTLVIGLAISSRKLLTRSAAFAALMISKLLRG